MAMAHGMAPIIMSMRLSARARICIILELPSSGMHAEDRLRVWRTGCSARRQRPLWLAASMALAAVLGAVCTVAPAAATAVFVDSDSSAAAGAMARSAASLWQAWTPAWSGPLAAIDIHLGAVQPCAEFDGVLKVYRGGPTPAAAELLHEQRVRTSCSGCQPGPGTCLFAPACQKQTCLAWQHFELARAVHVEAGEPHLFALEGLAMASHSRPAFGAPLPDTLQKKLDGLLAKKAAVSVALPGPGAELPSACSLQLNPNLGPASAQFVFRTLMANPPPAGAGLGGAGQGSSPDSPGGSAGSSARGSSAASPAPLVAGLLVGGLLVAAVVLAVLLVNKGRRERTKDVLGLHPDRRYRVGPEPLDVASPSPPPPSRSQMSEMGFVPTAWAAVSKAPRADVERDEFDDVIADLYTLSAALLPIATARAGASSSPRSPSHLHVAQPSASDRSDTDAPQHPFAMPPTDESTESTA